MTWSVLLIFYKVATMPLIGTCARALQCIFVRRGDPESRSNVLKTIEARLGRRHTKEYPPIAVFPEGVRVVFVMRLWFTFQFYASMFYAVLLLCRHYNQRLLHCEISEGCFYFETTDSASGNIVHFQSI